MKTLLLIISAVVFSFSVTATAMAGGVKAPKTICLEINDEPGFIYCLATKPFGSIKVADDLKMQYYSIAGSFSHNGSADPIGGTGYMDGNFFAFQVSGQFFSGVTTHQSVQGSIQLSAEPVFGTIQVFLTTDGNPASLGTHVVHEVPCSNATGPDSLPNAEP